MSGDEFSHAVHNNKNDEVRIRERINIQIKKEDYCNYRAECGEHLNIMQGLCAFCIYRKQFNIPKMIEEYRKNVNSR